MQGRFDREALLPDRSASSSNARWLQAGFSSFAYRLAHPALPILLLLFYFA